MKECLREVEVDEGERKRGDEVVPEVVQVRKKPPAQIYQHANRLHRTHLRRISSRPTNLNNMKCRETESFFLEFRQDTGSLGRLVLESLTEPNRGIAGQPGPTLATRISVGFKGLGDSDTQRSQFHVFYFMMPPSAPR